MSGYASLTQPAELLVSGGQYRVNKLKWFYTKFSQNDKFSLNILDPRLRGEDNKSKCFVIPAQAGIQFFKLSLINRQIIE